MKKLIAILLALITLLSFAACSAKPEAAAEPAEKAAAEPAEEVAEEAAEEPAATGRLAEIKEAGVLQVATEPYFAPYEFIDPNQEGNAQYLGADIELMKAIAEEIGVELEIVPLDFTAVLAGITTGKYDMAISAIAYNLERAENMNLSHVYKNSEDGYGFIVREEDQDKYNSIEDLADAVVATQSGSVQEGLYRADVTDKGCKELKLFAQMTDAFLAVQEGRADVCICNIGSAQLYAEANGGLFVPDFRFDVDPDMNGVVVACPLEDTDELMEVINKVVDELKADGTIEAWFEEAAAQAEELGIE